MDNHFTDFFPFGAQYHRAPTPLESEWDGDLAEIMDPFYRFPMSIDNKSLGDSPLWPQVRDCASADNCSNCGKCAELFKAVAKNRADAGHDMSGTFKGFFKG